MARLWKVRVGAPASTRACASGTPPLDRGVRLRVAGEAPAYRAHDADLDGVDGLGHYLFPFLELHDLQSGWMLEI